VELDQVLRVKSLLAAFGNPSKLLSEAITPPAPSRVSAAVRGLYEAGALAGNDEASAVTALGRFATQLPVDLLLVKLLLFARVFRSARTPFPSAPPLSISLSHCLYVCCSPTRHAQNLCHLRRYRRPFPLSGALHLSQLDASGLWGILSLCSTPPHTPPTPLRCLPEAIVMAAALSLQDVFSMPSSMLVRSPKAFAAALEG